MTYNRMEAKPIAGEHCRFCGDANAPLVKTPCCEQWICCDTAFFSFRGGGRCQVEHERFSLCYSHYEVEHSVILTFPVAAVGTVQTPAPVYRYTWHSAVLTCDCCSPHTTTHRSA